MSGDKSRSLTFKGSGTACNWDRSTAHRVPILWRVNEIIQFDRHGRLAALPARAEG